MKVKIKKLHPAAIIPQYATTGAACFDLHAICDPSPLLFINEDSLLANTGLSFEIPEGHVMMVYSRSGHGFKHDIRLANCTGVIDSDYRGEVMVKLTRDNFIAPPLTISNGDRIAQAMIVPVDRVEFEEVKELTDTERGTGGFGSTGSQ